MASTAATFPKRLWALCAISLLLLPLFAAARPAPLHRSSSARALLQTDPITHNHGTAVSALGYSFTGVDEHQNARMLLGPAKKKEIKSVMKAMKGIDWKKMGFKKVKPGL